MKCSILFICSPLLFNNDKRREDFKEYKRPLHILKSVYEEINFTREQPEKLYDTILLYLCNNK